ncbi:MAG: rod shape-determining protein MreC [Acidobacteria bacterium]|nr:rod shape-determining protein MreC [Acidobacteriota bacterium]
MWNWLSERKPALLLVLILGVLLVLLSHNAAGEEGRSRLEGALFRAGTPVLRSVDRVAAGLRWVRERFVSGRRLREENRVLREELRRARNLDPLGEEYRLENDRLRRLLGLQETISLPSISARITRGPDHGPFGTAILSIPRDGGVGPRMPVVSPAGLVGQVRTVSGAKATVHLILDRNSGVAVLTQRSRVQGVVSGGGSSGNLWMEFVVRGADVRPGDLVLTSGLDGVYPKGIPVGTVTRVWQDGGLTQQVELEPAVPFRRLEEVLILLKPPEELPVEDPGAAP